MPAFCCVVDCVSRRKRDPVRFFRIPQERNFAYKVHLNKLTVARRKMWLAAIRRADLIGTKLKNARVCSKHFISGEPAQLEDLKNPDWVPSLKMGSSTTGFQNKNRKKREQMSEDFEDIILIINEDDNQPNDDRSRISITTTHKASSFKNGYNNSRTTTITPKAPSYTNGHNRARTSITTTHKAPSCTNEHKEEEVNEKIEDNVLSASSISTDKYGPFVSNQLKLIRRNPVLMRGFEDKTPKKRAKISEEFEDIILIVHEDDNQSIPSFAAHDDRSRTSTTTTCNSHSHSFANAHKEKMDEGINDNVLAATISMDGFDMFGQFVGNQLKLIRDPVLALQAKQEIARVVDTFLQHDLVS